MHSGGTASTERVKSWEVTGVVFIASVKLTKLISCVTIHPVYDTFNRDGAGVAGFCGLHWGPGTWRCVPSSALVPPCARSESRPPGTAGGTVSGGWTSAARAYFSPIQQVASEFKKPSIARLQV